MSLCQEYFTFQGISYPYFGYYSNVVKSRRGSVDSNIFCLFNDAFKRIQTVAGHEIKKTGNDESTSFPGYEGVHISHPIKKAGNRNRTGYLHTPFFSCIHEVSVYIYL